MTNNIAQFEKIVAKLRHSIRPGISISSLATQLLHRSFLADYQTKWRTNEAPSLEVMERRGGPGPYGIRSPLGSDRPRGHRGDEQLRLSYQRGI